MAAQTKSDKTSTNPEVEALRNKIIDIDALSQSGFSQIESIAHLALLSLQTPDGYRHIRDIAFALEAIRHKAQDIQSCINSTAEDVDCNYIDESKHLRMNAHREFIREA
ncbi:hypothetical protein [Nitrosomonas sp.]|uniref:hypothetical protein n=1 Tax=Nitrosomonas sp. TaxID=42353 RepID=UPI00262B8832|nr:hypothetical protein [Nitrosomonas sp.]